jgi:hypothetical protein
MFLTAMGYHLNPEDCTIKDENYIRHFKDFQYILPCKYCRMSYKGFFDSLDIKKYLKEEWGLVRYVYDLKNLVSKKLREQESKALEQEFRKMIGTGKDIQDPEFWNHLREKAHKICYTKPAPPFDQVLDMYKGLRAKCSDETKSCREPYTNEKPYFSQSFGGKKQRKKSSRRKRTTRTR